MQEKDGKDGLGMPFRGLNYSGKPLNLQLSGQSWPCNLSSLLDVFLNHSPSGTQRPLVYLF